jgi:hypothetical protein
MLLLQPGVVTHSMYEVVGLFFGACRFSMTDVVECTAAVIWTAATCVHALALVCLQYAAHRMVPPVNAFTSWL